MLYFTEYKYFCIIFRYLLITHFNKINVNILFYWLQEVKTIIAITVIELFLSYSSSGFTIIKLSSAPTSSNQKTLCIGYGVLIGYLYGENEYQTRTRKFFYRNSCSGH